MLQMFCFYWVMCKPKTTKKGTIMQERFHCVGCGSKENLYNQRFNSYHKASMCYLCHGRMNIEIQQIIDVFVKVIVFDNIFEFWFKKATISCYVANFLVDWYKKLNFQLSLKINHQIMGFSNTLASYHVSVLVCSTTNESYSVKKSCKCAVTSESSNEISHFLCHCWKYRGYVVSILLK